MVSNIMSQPGSFDSCFTLPFALLVFVHWQHVLMLHGPPPRQGAAGRMQPVLQLGIGMTPRTVHTLQLLHLPHPILQPRI